MSLSLLKQFVNWIALWIAIEGISLFFLLSDIACMASQIDTFHYVNSN